MSSKRKSPDDLATSAKLQVSDSQPNTQTCQFGHTIKIEDPPKPIAFDHERGREINDNIGHYRTIMDDGASIVTYEDLETYSSFDDHGTWILSLSVRGISASRERSIQ